MGTRLSLAPAFKLYTMKFNILPLFTVFAFFGCSCTENGPAQGGDSAEINVQVTPQSVSLTSEAQDVILEVNADSDWGVFAEDKWLKTVPTGGGKGKTELKVIAEANYGSKARESVLTFRTASGRVEIPVAQEGMGDDALAPEGYELVWNDEFDDPTLTMPDESKWWYETAEPGWVNNELQTYVAGKIGDIVTADVSDGTLKIRAIKSGSRVYSARVNTKENWTYGYFEARLKLPEGKGTWPAFWMMPSVWSGWPEGGEIDIMEHVGCVPTEVSSSIHCKAYYHAVGTQKTAARKIAGVMDEFHIYALEWTPEYIKSFVDGEQLFYYNPDDYPQGRNAETWPFNKPFELKLNLAWGGDWGGMYGVDESCLPATYEIDYVRVFQKQ